MCFRPTKVDAGPEKCPKCGADVPQGADACPNCGVTRAELAATFIPTVGAAGVPGAPKAPSAPKPPSPPRA